MLYMEDALRAMRGGWLATDDDRVIKAFHDELLQRMAGDIGTDPAKLADALKVWAREAMHYELQPAPREMRDELARLAVALDAARDALDEAERRLCELSPVAEDALIAAELEAQGTTGVAGHRSARQAFQRRQRQVAVATSPVQRALTAALPVARAAAASIKVRRGPPERRDLFRLVDHLANIFEDVTDRRAGRVWNVDGERDASALTHSLGPAWR